MLYDAVYVPINAEEFELAERICDETLDDARARGSAARHRHHIVFCSHLAYRRGSIPDAETDAWAGLKAAEIGGYAVAPMALALLIDALLEQGELAAATRTLQQHAFEEALPDNFNLLLFSRGRLRIAAAQTESGVADVRELGRREQHSRAPPRSRSSAPTSASSGTSPRASRTTASRRSTSSPLGSRASRSTSTSSPAA